MSSVFLTVRRWRLLAVVALLGACGLVLPSGAQIPGISLPQGRDAPVEASEPVEVRLARWQKEARETLARLNEPAAESKLPDGITPAALANRRRDVEQTLLVIDRHLKTLAGADDARKALEAARAADGEWAGFEQSPPYSALMLDELENRRDAVKEKAETYKSSIALFQNTLTTIQRDAKEGEESLQAALTVADVANGGGDAAKWKVDAARAKVRLLAARAGSVQASIAVLQDQSATAASELALLDRQISIVRKDVKLDDEDIAVVKKVAADRQAALRKEAVVFRQRQKDAVAALSRAQSELDKLMESAPEGQEPEGLALAKLRVESAALRVDTLQMMIESLQSFEQLESFAPEAYEIRRTLVGGASSEDREAAEKSLRELDDRLNAWGVVSANELAAVGADLNNLESRSASVAAEDPRYPLLADQRAILWERQDLIQRVAQTVAGQRRIIGRWLAELETDDAGLGWTDKVGGEISRIWAAVRRFWSIEVFKYDDTVEIDGVKVPAKRAVTLGVIIRAILLFIIVYSIAAWLSKRVQGFMVGRKRIAEAQARTLRNWLMIFVGFFLALATLHSLNIPLTIFAFLGGALAIGLGFGTQTLIKNFISGIIVLFERKIRVGDVLDVGGVVGAVTEINTRSSVIRSADGVETMVPNSMFLENRMTNWTLTNRLLRRELRVGVAYGTAPQKVMEILMDAVDRHGLVLKDPAPFSVFEDFGDNALIFIVYFWVELNEKTNPAVVASDLRIMIDKRFNELGIGVPYPQRDMHLTTPEPLRIRMVDGEEQPKP